MCSLSPLKCPLRVHPAIFIQTACSSLLISQSAARRLSALKKMSQYLDPILKEIEANYTIHHTSAIMKKMWWVPPVAVSLYLIVVVLGKKWMGSVQQPYSARSILFIWNVFLALFSALGTFVMMPSLVETIIQRGFLYSVCYTTTHTVSIQSFFAFLFVLSKMVEFGDTFFIIIRKTPLSFLHVYHHMTACIISWRSLAIKSAPAHWYCALNYGVHMIMYSYFVVKSTGFRIPKMVALGVTVLQLLQFVVALVVISTASILYLAGNFCNTDEVNIFLSVVIYSTYMILFGNFFYQRYVKTSKKKVQ